MANAIKHKQRSSRSHQINSIPVNMFYRHAQAVADAQFVRKMAKASNVAAEAVEGEVVE